MVVWARVPDRNGVVKATARPLLITSVHPKDKKAPFVAHCISTRPVSDDDPAIEMPWDADSGGSAGLFTKCAVVLRWFVIVDQGEEEDISGKVPDEFLRHVLDEIARVN
jgi:hypothetical protein